MPQFSNINTWNESLGYSKLRCFTDSDGHFWLEQNPTKPSKWGKLVKAGHEVAWELESLGGAYTGRILIDGEIYSTPDAVKAFLKGAGK